jgi:glyoxylase-like metal-dependent hydrolase (beta-lactamase superfamily II)
MYDILNAHNIGFAFDELEMLEDVDEDEEVAEAPAKVETPKVEVPKKEAKAEEKVDTKVTAIPTVPKTPEVTKVAQVVSAEKVAVAQKLTSTDTEKSVGNIIKEAVSRESRVSRGTREETKAEVKADINSTKADINSTKADIFDYKLEPKKVSENVWCFFGAIEPPTKENAGNMANNCYIKTNSGYVVMDTGPSYQFAKQAYEAMSKIEKLPVRYVVNSHEHDDHWLGNDFYKKEFGATLIGPESVNTNYKEGTPTRMFNVLPKNAIVGTHIIKLNETPKKKYTLTFGGEKFEIIPMDTKAHTGDDIFIYMPERKILFAGDLVMNGRITSGRHGSVMGQLKALAMMKKLDWKIMVPGHGFITDGTAMDEADMYFTLTKERVLKAIDEGVDATEINEVVKLIEFKDKAMYDILNAHNIGFAFDELEMLD